MLITHCNRTEFVVASARENCDETVEKLLFLQKIKEKAALPDPY